MKMDVWCDSVEVIRGMKRFYTDRKGTTELKVASMRTHGKFMLISIEGVDSIEQAERYKGKELFADRDDIPKDEGAYFIDDLLGLPVYNAATNVVLGKVTDVMNRGAGDILEITRGNGGQILVPMADEFMAKVDPEDGIYINVIDGLCDEDDNDDAF